MLLHNRTNFYHIAPPCDIRLFMQSFSNEQSSNGNRTNFYRSAPTCDQRLFMQSFSNEQSPNGQNLGVFYGSIDSFRGPIFVTEKLFQNRTNFYHIAPPLI
ncbi:hypothetical protein OROMI_006274 [Orobanche minor]